MLGLSSIINFFLDLLVYIAALVTLILGGIEFKRWLKYRSKTKYTEEIQYAKPILTEEERLAKVNGRTYKVLGYLFIFLSPVVGFVISMIPNNPQGRIHILPESLRPPIMQGFLWFGICFLAGVVILIYGAIQRWINNPDD